MANTFRQGDQQYDIYRKILQAGGGSGGITPIPPPPVVIIDPDVAAWAAQVVTNGGAMPSQATQIALSTYATGAKSTTLWGALDTIWVPVPDSLIAACTPLKKSTGNALWINHNFINADLSVSGLKGGATKYLETGIILTNTGMHSSAAGASVYCADAPVASGNEYTFGCGDSNEEAFSQFAIIPSNAVNIGNGFLWLFNTGTTSWAPVGAGYYTMSRLLATGLRTNFGNSGTPFGLLNSTLSGSGVLFGTTPLTVFAINATGAVVANYTKTLSYFSLNIGLDDTTSAQEFNLVQALRTTLGGGFV